MKNTLHTLKAKEMKSTLDNCFIVAKDRFINTLADDACTEISYFLTQETKISKQKVFQNTREMATNKSIKYLDDIQSAFYNLSEQGINQIKKGYFIFFIYHDTNSSKEQLQVSKDLVYAILDTLYHYFYQILIYEYKDEITSQYNKAISLLPLYEYNSINRSVKKVPGLIDDRVMRDRVLVCGKLLSYRKGDEKYLFFKYLILQDKKCLYRPQQQSAIKGMARRIVGNDKLVLSKIKTLPSYFIKLSKHSFIDII